MTADPRATTAAAQYALLAALTAGGQAPPGFDETRIRTQAHALLTKRQRVARAHHTWLADALGPGYTAAFTAYARAHPLPAGRTGHADAEAFETYLRDRGELPARPRGRFRRRAGTPRRRGR